jgi:hypothetical protein
MKTSIALMSGQDKCHLLVNQSLGLIGIHLAGGGQVQPLLVGFKVRRPWDRFLFK